MNQPKIELRIHGEAHHPTLIYLPGLHGDWTLVASFRAAMASRVRFVEFTYPCRCDWSLRDYADAVLRALERHQITSGWLLGESFGSQVAWSIAERCESELEPFRPSGIVLAGGFVRHPVIPGVHCFHGLHGAMPFPMFRLVLRFYAAYARLRHRRAPETLDSIHEFLARRTREDCAAIGSRYPLIARSDLRPVARRTRLPVFALSGFFDPIVFWPVVIPWLRRHCPGFAGSRVLCKADHNVLGTAPVAAAEQVWNWMNGARNEIPVVVHSPNFAVPQ